ncbi:MAG: DUF1670 domain-containing protein [Armatimonadota bacterium]
MIPAPPAVKRYASAQKRFLGATIAHFFAETFPRLFGPDIRARLAERLVELVEAQCPPATHLRPGQCVWNAVPCDLRADSPRFHAVPVILTLVEEEDITRLAQGEALQTVQQDAIARMMREAYDQGALLSVRDIGLLTWRRDSSISQLKSAWEVRCDAVLPHPGTLQDMGSCLTHKTAIIVKALYERQDPRQVARQTHHTQKAVDRYLKDFQRVRLCYQHQPELDFICQATGLRPFLVKQYITILEKYGNAS